MSENIKKNLLKVREMTIEDAEETAQIEAENFSKPWKQKDFEDAVRSKNTLYMVIENQDEIIGYAGMWLVLDEGEITNVSIKKSCWGQRAGTHLMEEFLKEAKKRGGMSFFLECERVIYVQESYTVPLDLKRLMCGKSFMKSRSKMESLCVKDSRIAIFFYI